MACDDFVVAHTGSAQSYARSLARMYDLHSKTGIRLLVPALLGPKISLADRIESLLRRGRKFSARPSRTYLAVSALMLISLLGAGEIIPCWITVAQAEKLPSFEVASIRLDKSHRPLSGGHLFGTYFAGTGPVIEMIKVAYGQDGRPLNADQVSGGPSWIRSDIYDIKAKVSDSGDNLNWKKQPFEQRYTQVLLMLRSLLINRFKLQVKHESRVLPVFELVLAKKGPKLAEDNAYQEVAAVSALGRGELKATSSKLGPFVFILSRQPELGGRVLLDKTGLHSRYSFKFHWTPERSVSWSNPMAGRIATSEASGPSLFSALREQLGLRIKSAKAPVDIIDIDHIERPTPN